MVFDVANKILISNLPVQVILVNFWDIDFVVNIQENKLPAGKTLRVHAKFDDAPALVPAEFFILHVLTYTKLNRYHNL